MKTIIIERKNGRMIIEVNDEADLTEVLKEHEVTSYKSLTVLVEQKFVKAKGQYIKAK